MKLVARNNRMDSSKINGASAESAEQQSPGGMEQRQQSPEGATQADCVAPSGLNLHLVLFPRVPALRAFTLGFAVPRFQRCTFATIHSIVIGH
jgi:hypothetical protein